VLAKGNATKYSETTEIQQQLTVSGDAGQSHARVSAHNVVLIKQQHQQALNNFTSVQQR